MRVCKRQQANLSKGLYFDEISTGIWALAGKGQFLAHAGLPSHSDWHFSIYSMYRKEAATGAALVVFSVRSTEGAPATAIFRNWVKARQ